MGLPSAFALGARAASEVLAAGTYIYSARSRLKMATAARSDSALARIVASFTVCCDCVYLNVLSPSKSRTRPPVGLVKYLQSSRERASKAIPVETSNPATLQLWALPSANRATNFGCCGEVLRELARTCASCTQAALVSIRPSPETIDPLAAPSVGNASI